MTRPSGPLASSTEAAAQRAGHGWALIKAGRHLEALALLMALANEHPRFPSARELLAFALQGMGDLDGAEREMRAAIRLDKRDPALHTGLGEILFSKGGVEEAERALRTALALKRFYAPAAVSLTRVLLSQGRAVEALQATTPLALREDAPPAVLEAHVACLRALERNDDALAIAQRAVDAPGADPRLNTVVAEILVQLGRHAEAEAHLRRALTQTPQEPTLHLALADLVWKRTGSLSEATKVLDAALTQAPTAPLLTAWAEVATRGGGGDEAYQTLAAALARRPDDMDLTLAAARAASAAGRTDDFVVQAERAFALQPDREGVKAMLADAYLRIDQPERALKIADALLEVAPFDQQAIATRAMALRLLDDPRYREVYDYPEMVRSFMIETPPGWPSLQAYLADLGGALGELHRLEHHPLDQSLRGGTQTVGDLTRAKAAAIQAFFEAVDAPIRRYLGDLGVGDDPLRRRNTGLYRIQSAWSVRLRPGGRHVSHLHPDGWISSAFYVDLPRAIEEPGRQGWLQFGAPGSEFARPLAADHLVKPSPGQLVLFPSYMLHGTAPFAGPDTRLTIAFDVAPAFTSDARLRKSLR